MSLVFHKKTTEKQKENKKRKVDKNVKFNSKYYQKYILTPIFKYEIPNIYPQCHQSVELHQNKANNHTAQCTIAFQEKMEQKTRFKIISVTDIPAKSPDVSPAEFMCLKSALSECRPHVHNNYAVRLNRKNKFV